MSKLVMIDSNVFTNNVLHTSDAVSVDDLVKRIKQNGQPKYITNDSLSRFETSPDIPIYCVPLYAEGQAAIFSNAVLPTEVQTENVANFLVNKKQVNRHLLIRLVELYNIDINYTWSGISRHFDMTEIISEINSIDSLGWLTEGQRMHLLAPIELPPKWIEFPSQQKSDVSVNNFGGFYWTWVNGIDAVVSTSAISLISESLRFEKATFFTEKTMYSVLGLTFPLWIGGGNKQADEWKKLGFDAFDDVINHDYQHYDTLIERCWWAFALNLDLLTDKKKAAKLRQINLERLINNRALFLGNHLMQQNDKIIATWPQEIQAVYEPIKQYWRQER